MEKNIQDDLQNNPNNVISNITWKTLSDTEIEILKYGLKHGFCHTSIWSRNDRNSTDQIEQKRLCNHFMRRRRVKTALRAFTYVYIDIYDKQRSHDKNKNNTIKKVREKYMIWKLDKDNQVVLMNNVAFHDAMK